MAIPHDPQAVLDYAWDWTDWLAEAETITSFTVTVPDGLTLGDTSQAAGKVTAWISGGTAGTLYRVVCHIVTSAGREDDRTLTLYCANR